MDMTTILELVKARQGISTKIRDTFLTAIVEGIIKELEDEKGLTLSVDNPNQLMFVVDYASWRYESKGHEGSMPRHLQYRLHNLIINNKEGGTIG